jgi:hypothetical protein
MKLVRVFLLLGCLGIPLSGIAGTSSAERVAVHVAKNDFQIWEINRATIDAQKKVIRSYLKRNAKHRVAVRTVLGAAIVAGLGYWYYASHRTPAALPAGAKLSVDPNTLAAVRDGVAVGAENVILARAELLEIKKSIEMLAADKFKQPVDQISKGVAAAVAQVGKDAVTGTYKFIHGIGYYFYQNLPAVVAGGFVNLLIFRDLPTLVDAAKYCFVRPIKRINHPHSLEWFLVTQIKIERARYRIDLQRPYPGEHNENVGYRLNYDKFFNASMRTASMLPLASDEFERGHYMTSLVTDLNFLMRQMARIIAFCEIRTESVSKHNKTCGRHLKEETAYVLTLTEKLGKDIALLLSSQESQVKILSLLEDFKLKVAEQLESFSLYEQAAFLDFTPAE